MKSDTVAKPVGRPLAVAEIRHGEVRPCRIDCSELLAQYEALVQVTDVSSGNLHTSAGKVCSSSEIELTVTAPWPVKAHFLDHLVEARVKTTKGVITVAFTLRVYGNAE